MEIKKTQYRVADFLAWQRQGNLDLNPVFQRRSVWSSGAKSFFIDTVVRGWPAPVIYIWERIDLASQEATREVVDGQQRLRTLFAFIDPSCLADFDESDDFLVKAIHNKSIADTPYGDLPEDVKHDILGYEFSTHVLPSQIEEREVLQIFSRLNSTGVRLNRQELRNAEYFGDFKTEMYNLALEQLERWRLWLRNAEIRIARMLEVEITSDLCILIVSGVTKKTQQIISRYYGDFDEMFPGRNEVSRRFRTVMDAIDGLIGTEISSSAYSLDIHFYSLFAYLYDKMFGLGSNLAKRSPNRLPKSLREYLMDASTQIDDEEYPEEYAEAFQSVRPDAVSRQQRLRFLAEVCDGAFDT
ncbi:MAG TPA: DUF262 domain-containing protein [Candidatus Rubrimentiphilum sp.]|nr:DUF262 domain-containing protein [Candidatus Rubrimentiphilum sp.]